MSYVDHGPQLGLILGLVFGFALPVIVIVLLVVIFCVRRKRRAAQKRQRRPIVMMSNRGGRTDRVRNSYQDIQDQARPQPLELRPLQPVPAADTPRRAEEPVKGNRGLTVIALIFTSILNQMIFDDSEFCQKQLVEIFKCIITLISHRECSTLYGL